MADADPNAWFFFNSEVDILICIPCGVAIFPGRGSGGVSGHLNGSHSKKDEPWYLDLDCREALAMTQVHRVLNPEPPVPPAEGDRIQHLAQPVPGARCKDCSFVCKAVSTMELHCHTMHGWKRRNTGTKTMKQGAKFKGQDHWVDCQVQ